MTAEDRQSTDVWSVVPQLFYDIIARIIPGAAIAGALALSWFGLERAWLGVREWGRGASETYTPAILVVLLLFFVSYVISVMCLGLWSLPEFVRGLTKGGAGGVGPEQEFSRKYDYIKFKNHAAGSRITKLHAEIHMTQTLMLGFAFSLAVSFLRLGGAADGAHFYLRLVLLLGFVGSFGARSHFLKRQRGAIDNNAELLGYPGDCWRPKPTGVQPPPVASSPPASSGPPPSSSSSPSPAGS